MAGRKVFQAATVLTAADVNDFLMDQAVMVFANSTARASAIGTPTAGMVSYLQDTSALQVYGTAWANVSSPGDITAVTAGTGLTGGGTSGDVTLNVNYAQVIPTSIVTATGDLIVANGNASVTRLGIGTTGQALVSNGTTAVWGAPNPSYADWEVLASGSITTGSSSMTISGWSARDNLVLFVNSISGSLTTAQGVEIRLNADSSNHNATYANIRGLSTYSAGIVNDATLSAFRIGVLSTNASSVVTGGIQISGARKTTGSIAMCDIFGAGGAAGGNSNEAWIGKGYYDGAAAVTSLQIRLSGVGNNIDGGSYVLLGSD